MKIKLMQSPILLLCFCILIITSSCGDEAVIDPANTCPNCELEPMAGGCDASYQIYYFDKAENKCKEFTWGGCGGVVPFETLEECELCKCAN